MDDVIIAASALMVIENNLKKKKQKNRKIWAADFLKKRSQYNGNIIRNDLLLNSGQFENFCRMSKSDFELLLNLIGPKIAKEDTNYRKSISATERLAVTLRFLATGDSYGSLKYLFRISKQSLSTIIPETCAAIIEALQSYVKLPNSQEEWIQIAAMFEDRWNFKNCLGAIDRKHCVIQAPFNSGSDYYNYKSTFTVVLLAIVDADYLFSYANVGCQGRISDGGVFNNSIFYKKLKEGSLKLPESTILPGRQKEVPYVFVADDAFPLHHHILKPYTGIFPKGSTNRIFNYRVSRARRVVENAFGILSSVFRVLRKPILLEPAKATTIILATVHLHNFLRKIPTSRNSYAPPRIFDQESNGTVIPGDWREESSSQTFFTPLARVPRKSSQSCEEIRSEYAEFFVTTGKVAWQDDYA